MRRLSAISKIIGVGKKESDYFLYTPLLKRILEVNPKKRIKIEVSEPQTEKKGGFFGGSSYTILIECKELNASSRKNVADLTWLYQKLSETYPYDIIPPLKSFGYFSKSDLECNHRYIQRFFDLICRRKILRTSSLLYNFLTLPDEQFKKYKSEINKANLTIQPDFSNFITCKGELKFGITPEKAIFANSISNYISPTVDLLDKLFLTLKNISTLYDNLGQHMKLASNLCLGIAREWQKFKHKEKGTIAFSHWNVQLSKCSESYLQLSKIFSEEIKENFDFMKLEIGQITPIIKKFEHKRDAYEAYGAKLKKKKEELFASKKFSKWEINPKEYVDFQSLQADKKKAFSVMCYKENLQLDELKKQVSVCIEKLVNQFDKIFKYEEEQILAFGKNFLESHQKLAEEDMNVIKMFVPQFG